jgi:threonine dehydratase
VVPVGGGGLIAGMALALKHINPRIQIFGVESTNVPGMAESLKAGKVVKVPKKRTMAEGIAVQQVGDLTFEIVNNLVEDIVLVEEDEVIQILVTIADVLDC